MYGTKYTAAQRSNIGRSGSWPKKSDPPPLGFGDLARFAFPVKTIAALGAKTGAGRSTVKAWLNGTHHPPFEVLAICTAEINLRLAGQS